MQLRVCRVGLSVQLAAVTCSFRPAKFLHFGSCRLERSCTSTWPSLTTQQPPAILIEAENPPFRQACNTERLLWEHCWRVKLCNCIVTVVSRGQHEVFCCPRGIGQATYPKGGLDIACNSGLEGNGTLSLSNALIALHSERVTVQCTSNGRRANSAVDAARSTRWLWSTRYLVIPEAKTEGTSST